MRLAVLTSLLVLLCGQAYAGVTMLEETQDIGCDTVDLKAAGQSNSRGDFDRIVVDKRETKLTLYKAANVVGEFTKVKFLDSAFLTQSIQHPELFALFQIFPSGEVVITQGDRLSFEEKDCDDTGASKTCKTSKIKKLYWTPEKLQVEYAGNVVKEAVRGPVVLYGYLANHATYLYAKTMTLLDYGADLDLIVGTSVSLKCRYL